MSRDRGYATRFVGNVQEAVPLSLFSFHETCERPVDVGSKLFGGGRSIPDAENRSGIRELRGDASHMS